MNMQSAIFETFAGDRPHRSSLQLPERLSQRWRILLPCLDAAAILLLALIPFSGSTNAFAAAVVTASLVCGIAWQAGLYARSFAVFARDEMYYACTCVAIAAVPTLIVLGAVADIGVVPIIVALILSALAMSVVHVRLHLQRRTGPRPAAGLRSITPYGWSQRESNGYRIRKRVFDTAVAAIVLIVFSPIMLATAIAILIESGRPVLFLQKRLGENAAPFVMLKFRTMRNDAGGMWARPGDDRITPLGSFLRRTSLDELPQLFNVIRGEMSIVGPRPEMVDFAEKFAGAIPNYAQRHVVTPGITGWAQLYFRRNFTPDDVRDVLPYDLFYVEHASLTMDCALILKTLGEVLFHRAV